MMVSSPAVVGAVVEVEEEASAFILSSFLCDCLLGGCYYDPNELLSRGKSRLGSW